MIANTNPRSGTAPGWPTLASCIAASSLLWFLATGLHPFWPAAWLAPAPILYVVFRSTARVAFGSAALAWLLGSATLLPYLLLVMPPLPLTLVTILRALVCGMIALLAWKAARRFPPALAVFAFPAAWVAYEFLLSFRKDGTALSIAYSQMDFLPVLQIASVAGIWGVTFIVLLAPSAIALAFARKSFAPIAISAPFVVATLAFGYLRLESPQKKPVVAVGLAATDEGIIRSFRTRDATVALQTAHQYAEYVRMLALRGAQIVVLPEKFVGLTPADSAEVRAMFRNVALQAGVTVVAGFNCIGMNPSRNVAAVFAPNGREILEYDKRHFLTSLESGYLIGNAPGLFQAPGAQWGVAICKDMDFPAWSREYGRRGVRIMAVPAWDFGIDGKLHGRMAHLRAIENGFTLVRVAQDGLVSVSDAKGRVLVEKASAQNPALVVAQAPAGPGATIYTRTGDWLGWLCLAAVAGILIPAGRPTGA